MVEIDVAVVKVEVKPELAEDVEVPAEVSVLPPAADVVAVVVVVELVVTPEVDEKGK